MDIDQFRYRSGVSFLFLENAAGDVISIPVYMILFNEDLLYSLPTIETRRGEQLKLEVKHSNRRFRVWINQEDELRVRIEEFSYDEEEWQIVHSYRAL